MRALLVVAVLCGVVVAGPKPKPKAPPNLVVLVDRSGSMTGEKLEAAKRAVVDAAKAIGPEAQIAVVAFDSEAQLYVKPQRVGDGKRVAAEIARLQAGGGTNIYPALAIARDLVRDMKGPRHVVLITDGQAPVDGLREIAWDLVDMNTTVSAIGIGGDADRALLTMLADAGGGRMAMIEDPDALPSVLVNDARTAFTIPTFGKHPRGTFVLVLDRSSSMRHALIAEENAVVAVLHELAPDDQLGIVVFDSTGEVLLPVQPVGDGTRVVAQVAMIEVGGGTNVYSGMRVAREALDGVKGPIHIIVVTDGDAAPDGVAELALEMPGTVSAVSLGGGRELAAAIAGRGGGRVYFVDDPNALGATLAADVRAAFE